MIQRLSERRLFSLVVYVVRMSLPISALTAQCVDVVSAALNNHRPRGAVVSSSADYFLLVVDLLF